MPTIAELKLQKLQAEVERQNILNDTILATLVRIEDVDAVVADMVVAIRSKLMGYPASVAHLILGKENYDEVVKILMKHLEEALMDLKGLDHEAIKARNKKTQKIYFATRERITKK